MDSAENMTCKELLQRAVCWCEDSLKSKMLLELAAGLMVIFDHPHT